jgi:hypothetical protein
MVMHYVYFATIKKFCYIISKPVFLQKPDVLRQSNGSTDSEEWLLHIDSQQSPETCSGCRRERLRRRLRLVFFVTV